MIHDFEPMRLIRTAVDVHPPWDMETVDFQSASVTGLRDGQYITEERVTGFHLTCEHVVTTHAEVGGLCSFCYVLAQEESLPFAYFISLKCVCCLKRCAAPFCAQGLCLLHSGSLPEDEREYCREHFEERRHELAVAQQGRLAAELGRFCKGFFFDKEVVEQMVQTIRRTRADEFSMVREMLQGHAATRRRSLNESWEA